MDAIIVEKGRVRTRYSNRAQDRQVALETRKGYLQKISGALADTEDVRVWNEISSNMELHTSAPSELCHMVECCNNINCEPKKLKFMVALAAATWAIWTERNARWAYSRFTAAAVTATRVIAIVNASLN